MFNFHRSKKLKGGLLPSFAMGNLREMKVIGLRGMIQLLGGIGLIVSISNYFPGVNREPELINALPSLVGLFFFVASVLFFRAGNFRFSSWSVLLTIFSAFSLELLLTGEINQFSFYGFFVLAFLGGMVLTQSQLVVLISSLLIVGITNYLIIRLNLFPVIFNPTTVNLDVIIHTFLLAVSTMIGWMLGQELDKTFERSEKLSQKFQAIFAQSADAIFITDLEFGILDLNQQAAELLKIPTEQVVGKRLLDLIPQVVMKDINELVGDIFKNGKISNIRMPIKTREGVQQFLQISANLIFHEGGRPDHIQVIVRDITERKMTEARIQQLALQDHLTKVDNRLSLTYRLNSLITTMNRDGGSFVLVYFDLDNFKNINDRYGHFIGDQLLVAFTKRLQGVIRGTDFLARMGGDEFVLILENYLTEEEFESTINRIMVCLNEPFKIGEHLIFLETSYGVSHYPEDGTEAEDLLKLADSAMYVNKNN